MVRYVRDEEVIADALRRTRAGVRDVQRFTGTERRQTADVAEQAWDQSEFAKDLAEDLEVVLNPLPAQVQEALDEAEAAAELAGVVDARTVVIGRTVDGLNRILVSKDSPGSGFIGHENVAPSLYGPTSTVTVRRNLVPSPVNFSAGLELSRCTITATGGVVTATVNAVGFFPRVITAQAVRGQFPVTPGDQMTGSFKMHTSGVVYNMRMNWFSSPTVSVGTSAQFTQIGVAGQYFTQTVTVPAGAVYGQLEIGVANNTPISTQFAYSEPQFVVGPQRLPFWAVGIPSPDPDMEPAWAGTPESSPTLLQGQHPTAFIDNLCISIIHEVGDGTRELRVIPTTASTDSYTRIAIPAGLRVDATALGTIRLSASLAGTLASASRRLRAVLPEQLSSPQPPNTAGVYPQRLRSTTTSVYEQRFVNGGSVGAGDVYWSDIGLYAGDLPEDAERLHNGDQWYQLDDDNHVETINIWNGHAWAPLQIVADSVVAINSVSTALLQATAIDGMTITGALIRTAPTGQRMQFDLNGLRAFNASNAETAKLEAATGGMRLSSALFFGEPEVSGISAQISKQRFQPLNTYTHGTLGELYDNGDYASGSFAILSEDTSEHVGRISAGVTPAVAGLSFVANPTTNPNAAYTAGITKRADKSLVIDNGGGQILIATQGRPDADSNTSPAVRLKPGDLGEDTVELIASGPVRVEGLEIVLDGPLKFEGTTRWVLGVEGVITPSSGTTLQGAHLVKRPDGMVELSCRFNRIASIATSQALGQLPAGFYPEIVWADAGTCAPATAQSSALRIGTDGALSYTGTTVSTSFWVSTRYKAAA